MASETQKRQNGMEKGCFGSGVITSFRAGGRTKERAMPTLNQLIQDSIRGLNATQELISMRLAA